MIRNVCKKGFFVVAILCISLAIFFGYRLIAGNIKAHFLKLSKDVFNADVSIERAYLRLPVCLELKGIKINNTIDISSVRVYPNPISFFIKNKLIISRVNIINPVIRIKKEDVAQWNAADFLKAKEERDGQGFLLPVLLFSKIHIHNGTVLFDKGGKNELEFINIKGNIKSPGFYFSEDNVFNFTMSGFLKNRETDFLSPLKIDGQAGPDSMIKAKLQIADVKMGTLGIIYDRYLSRIMKKGRFDLNSDIQISKSNMIAKCLLEGEDIVLEKDMGKEIEPPLLASFILFLSFKNGLVKLKDIQGNFLSLVFVL